MQFAAEQIAMLINGRVEGDANTMVGSIGKIEEARETYQNLLKLEPDNIGLKLHIDSLAPLISFSNSEIDLYRENLLKAIDK